MSKTFDITGIFAKDILHVTLYLHSHYRKIWKFQLCEEAIFNCGSAGIPRQHYMDMIIARRRA